MPVSKGKRYILTTLDNFSRHLTAIHCTRDHAIDAARRLYCFFLRQREMPRIVSSDRRTHFTGEVYKNFCDKMSIDRELHCLESVISSMNVTINSTIGISPCYVITSCQPNIGLPKLPHNELTNQSSTAFGIKINALLR